MIKNLKKPRKGKQNSAALRKKQVRRLAECSDDVREHALKAYFHYCKEKAAKNFIDWRIEQAEFMKDPVTKRALRLRRLANF